MQMRLEVQIAAMIKAMTDVVIPAVPADNKLAAEQARLVVGMLGLMARQLPLQYRFDRDELRRLLATAGALEALDLGGGAAAAAARALAASSEEAARTLSRCAGDPDELRQAVRQLRAALCALADGLDDTVPAPGRRALEDALLAMTREQTLRERALVKSQGWEADPDAIPEIEELLAKD